MKKLLTTIAIALLTKLSFGQTIKFPTTQRSILIEDGIYTCSPCYTWAKPMIDTLKQIYDSTLIYYIQERGAGTTSLCTMLASEMLNRAYTYPLGFSIASPSMYPNQIYVNNQLNDSFFLANTLHNIDSVNSLPTVASPIFETQLIGTDSMIVYTKTKFLQNADGDYRIGILLAQDSIYFYQAGAGGSIYHMHQLTGPELAFDGLGNLTFNGNDSLNYTLRNGYIPANTIFEDTFHFKLRPTQVAANMKPIAIVWKNEIVSIMNYTDSVWWDMNKLVYVNANEKPGFEYEDTSLAIISNNTNNYDLQIIPNPVYKNSVSKLIGDYQFATISIYDITGKLISTQTVTNNKAVDLSMLNQGLYIYDIQTNNNKHTKKKLQILD